MKYLYTLLLCLPAFLLASAQTSQAAKNAIGLRLLAIPTEWVTNSSIYAENLFPQREFANSLVYERFWGSVGARVGALVHFQSNIEPQDAYCGALCDQNFVQRQAFLPKIGFVARLPVGRFRPYFAVDFFRTRERSFVYAVYGDGASEHKLTIRNFAINPVLGVDYFVFKKLSFGLEIWGVFSRSKSKGYLKDYSGWSLQWTEKIVDDTRWDVDFSPLAAVWGRFHF